MFLIDIIIPATNKPEALQVVEHLDSLNVGIGLIIIVDFNRCSPSINLDKIKDSKIINRIKYVFVDGQIFFNKSLAINIAFQYVRQQYVVICDADVLLDMNFFMESKKRGEEKKNKKLFFSPRYVVESKTGDQRPAPGICFVSVEDFFSIKGYSSDFQGWGMEDVDFLRRLKLANVEKQCFSFGVHLTHEDDDRTRNYHSNSIDDMRLENRKRYKNKVKLQERYGTLTEDKDSALFEEYLS